MDLNTTMDVRSPQIFPTDAPNQWTPASSTAYAGKALMGPTPPNMKGGRRSRRRQSRRRQSRQSNRNKNQSKKSRRSRR